MAILTPLVRRSAVVALVAGLAMAVLLSTGPAPAPTGSQAAATVPSAKRRADFTPVTGAVFNKPTGSRAQQRRIFTYLNRTIDATPAGATIRFAVFSFSEKATADRLIAAYERGVDVQLIFDDHHIYGQQARLRKVIGTDRAAGSYVVFCHQSCRGTGGNMHSKVFLFSQAGAADHVVMVGSANITRHNAVDQWSDLYTVVGDPTLYATYAGVLDQMKYDRPQATPYFTAQVDEYSQEFYPYPGVDQAGDPIYQALSRMQCVGATEATGDDEGDSVLRLSLHAWNGTRGRYLAHKVAELYESGCNVAVIYGVGIGKVVRNIIRDAGIPMSNGTHRGVHTHEKVMMFSGVYGSDTAAHIVWTGSHNWSNGSLRRDEVILRIGDEQAYDAYYRNWRQIWRQG